MKFHNVQSGIFSFVQSSSTYNTILVNGMSISDQTKSILAVSPYQIWVFPCLSKHQLWLSACLQWELKKSLIPLPLSFPTFTAQLVCDVYLLFPLPSSHFPRTILKKKKITLLSVLPSFSQYNLWISSRLSLQYKLSPMLLRPYQYFPPTRIRNSYQDSVFELIYFSSALCNLRNYFTYTCIYYGRKELMYLRGTICFHFKFCSLFWGVWVLVSQVIMLNSLTRKANASL